MLLAAVAFAVCVLSAAALSAATAYTSRLRPAPLLAATVLVAAGYATLLAARPDGWLLANVTVFAVAVFLGSTLGWLVRSRVALVSFCLAAAVADVLSFYGGPTARLTEAFRSDSNDLLRYLCLSLPIQDSLRPIVGIGDLIILGTIYFAFHSLGHRGAAAFAAPASGLLLALVVGLAVGTVFAVPFIAATTLGYVWATGRRTERSDDRHEVPRDHPEL